MYAAISEMLGVLHRPLAVLAEGMGLSPLQAIIVVGMMVTGTQAFHPFFSAFLCFCLIFATHFLISSIKEHMSNGNFNSHITIITTSAKNDEMIFLFSLARKKPETSNLFVSVFVLVFAVLFFMENTWSFEYSGSHTVRGAPRPPGRPQQWQQQPDFHAPMEAWNARVPVGGALHMQHRPNSEHEHQIGPSVPRTAKPATFPTSSRQPRYSPRQQQMHHNHSWQQHSPGRSPRNGFRQQPSSFSPTQTSSKPINMTLTNSEALVTLQSICPG